MDFTRVCDSLGISVETARAWIAEGKLEFENPALKGTLPIGITERDVFGLALAAAITRGGRIGSFSLRVPGDTESIRHARPRRIVAWASRGIPNAGFGWVTDLEESPAVRELKARPDSVIVDIADVEARTTAAIAGSRE